MVTFLKRISNYLSKTDKVNWDPIIEYFETGALEDGFEITKLLDSKPGELLFADN